MKLPNGYGSVVKLKGKRRKPWAVRISYLQDSALAYLAEYNNGGLVQSIRNMLMCQRLQSCMRNGKNTVIP